MYLSGGPSAISFNSSGTFMWAAMPAPGAGRFSLEDDSSLAALSFSLLGGSRLSTLTFTGPVGNPLILYLPRMMKAVKDSCLPTSLTKVIRPSDRGSSLYVTSPVMSPLPLPQPTHSNRPAAASHACRRRTGRGLTFCTIGPLPLGCRWLPVSAEDVVPTGRT